MKNTLTIVMIVGTLLLLAAPAMADWNPGDGHKMHWPQLPDPNGWNVWFESPSALADDWECTQSGDVSDIHFWMSSREDISPETGYQSGFDTLGKIAKIHVTIHADVPVGPNGFSIPGDELWHRDFVLGEFSVREYGADSPQGWLDPYNPPAEQNDHFKTWQVNIADIPNPFPQQAGNIYWLALTIDGASGEGLAPLLGWKTSVSDQFRDDAVWAEDPHFAGFSSIRELKDPITDQSLDLAFVITPEPGTVAMLIGAVLMGLVAFARRRKKS